MDIRTKDANIGHEAQIGSISDEAVFYLMSRGMTEEDARACIVSGFADDVSKELPLEYAVEMNNLIRLEMKGTIALGRQTHRRSEQHENQPASIENMVLAGIK